MGELTHITAFRIGCLQFLDSIGDFAPESGGKVALLIFQKAQAQLNNAQSPSTIVAD